MYKKLLFLQLLAKGHNSFFGSIEQDRNYGGHKSPCKSFCLPGKKVLNIV